MGLQIQVHRIAVVTTLLLWSIGSASSQETTPDFEGMWSDPPATPEEMLCFAFCTDWGIDYMHSLLDDPANDDRPYMDLWSEVEASELDGYFRPHLTEAALETFPIDKADDPGFLRCEPWGFARQLFAPHQLEITQYSDRVEMRYGEWDAHRTVYLDGSVPAADQTPSLMGFSVGRYEGEALVIETTGVSENITLWWSHHSDQLRTIERYTVSDNRDRLFLTATMEDPWGLREPLVVKKVWSWAPDQEIAPYESCERPTEYSRGLN